NSREFRSGKKFTLSKFVEKTWNQEYLITRAVTTLTAAEGTADTRGNLIDSQRVEFAAIVGTTQFRLDAVTPRPMIRGPQTALVVGDSGEEITTNEYGQIKVQFYWDRVGQKNQDSSCWIRVAQSWGGTGWGSIVIPRIGMEVVVQFLEGNPDRPLVTGVVYNATQKVPNTLPDKTVLNNETVNITKDTTTTVKEGNRSVTVSQGNDSHTVSQGNRSVTVTQGSDSHTVSTGNMTVSVSAGGVSITAGQSITLTVGGNSIAISTSGITVTSAGPLTATGNPISLN